MKIGLSYLLLAGLLFALGVLAWQPLIAFLLIWSALAVLLVSLAYLGNYARVFRKRQDGRIPLYIKLLFVPFLLVAYLINRRQRRRDPVPAVQKIDRHLFLGCRLTRTDIAELRQQGVCAVLDVTCEFDGLNWAAEGENLDYLNVPVLDHAVPSIGELIQCINWIHQQVQRDRAVLIHCALGRGRSVMVLIAYLLCRDDRGDLEAIYQQVKQVRHTAGLNSRQLRTLRRWQREERLLLKSRMSIVVNAGAGSGDWAQQRNQLVGTLAPYFQLSFFEQQNEQSLQDCVQAAVADRPDVLAACGGDGTLSAAAAAICDTDIALGIIPMGTANAMAFALLGLDAKLDPIQSACDNLIQGEKIRIDSALCNDRRMLLLAGFGLEQEMTADAEGEAKQRWGEMAYLYSFLTALIRSPAKTYRLQLDGQPAEAIDTRSLIIANAAPFTSILARGGGTPRFQDGLLDITWIRSDSLIPEGISLLELLRSDKLQSGSGILVEHRQARRIEIEFDQPRPFVLDGELLQTEQLQIEIQPASLAVIAPKAPVDT